MGRDSRRVHRVAHALLAGSFAWILWPSAIAPAQEGAAPAVAATDAVSAETAAQSRRDRRRAAKAESATIPQDTETAAAAAAAKASADVAAESADETEIVCKNIKPLGTRMARRVCGTAAQWAALDKKTTDAASDDMRQVRGQGAVIATTPGPAVGPP
jgi:hypothetical protein